MIRQVSGITTRPVSATFDLRQLLAWASSTRGIWTIWGVTRVLMFINLVIGAHYCDPQFYQYAGDLAVGKLPYVNVPVEYPPLAMLFLLLPALPLLPFGAIAPQPAHITSPLYPDSLRYGAYGISFAICMLIVDALTLMLVLRVARRWTIGDAQGRWSGLIYVGLGMASGAVLQKFDLAVGTLTLLAIVLLLEKRDGWAWACLALAALTKGYPALLAPIFIMWTLSNNRFDWNAIRRSVIGGGTACAMLIAPIMLASGITPLLHSILYHADRGVEIESTWAALMLGVGWLPHMDISTFLSAGDLSLDIHSPLEDPFSRLAVPTMLLLTATLYWQFWRRLRKAQTYVQANTRSTVATERIMFTYLVHGSLAVMLVFILTFRAFPIHYMLAIVPLIAVLRLPDGTQLRWMTVLVLGMVFGEFAVTAWDPIIALVPTADLLLIVRNALIVVACVLLVRAPLEQLWQTPSRKWAA